MTATTCCGHDPGDSLRDIERIAQEVIMSEVTTDLPYRVTVEVGFILLEHIYDGPYIALNGDYFDDFGPPQMIQITEEDGFKATLMLLGGARTPQMRAATKVAEVGAAIFRRSYVDKDVSSELTKSLQAGKALSVTTFFPPGGIPEDLYHEMARRLYEAGADKVYYWGGIYPKMYEY